MAGYGFPFLVLAPALFLRRLDSLFTSGQVYWLLPVFAGLFVPALLLARFLSPAYRRRGSASFSTGMLVGGWAAGALLLWAAAADRPMGNRLLIAASGGPLMVGFWMWVGAFLGQASSERPELQSPAAKPAENR